ncbi:MAG: DUF7662 domain-containing protein [Caulobacteraceae bacterium]
MSKYEPLGVFLRSRSAEETPMRFEEIESVIGFALPPKAQNHPAWWSNNPSNNPMTRVWLDAGYRTERVDVSARRLVFHRTESPKSQMHPPAKDSGGGLADRVRAKLGGSIRFAPGFDPTEPTGEIWDAEK